MRYEDASLSGSFQDQGPVARDDSDQLANGDRGPATGNLISGAGTETGSAGADSGAGAKVTSVSGAGGQDVTFAGGQLRVEGEHGSLSVTALGDYVYRAKASVPENSRDTFTYTLADSDGQSSQARLIIEIGKAQTAVAANAQRVVPGPDGVVVLPAGVELSDIRIVGRDLLIMLPDGSQMLIVDGAVFVPQLVINDIEVPSTNLAALLIEAEPRPAGGVPQSSGGNFLTEVGRLDPGSALGDLLAPTELDYMPPEFQETGLEEDREPEVGDNPLVQLDDDARPGGNAGGTGDDPDGVNLSGVLSGSGGDGPLTFALLTSGAPAGFEYVAGPNGSLLVQQNGSTVMTVTVNAQTGAYTVTQNAAVLHGSGANENNALFPFSYSVTDRDGDSVSGSFSVNIDDDTPLIDVTAVADGGILLTTDDADSRGAAFDTASSSANFGAVFGVGQSAGGDGLGSASLTFTLSTGGGASGLSQGGVGINLFLIGGRVVGSTATNVGAVTAANSVFDVSVSGTGAVTLTQYSQIDHLSSNPSPTGAPFNHQLVSLADALVTLTASGAISDRDGDNASDSVSVQIGANLRFSDDGPSLTGAAAGAGVILDETRAGTPAGFPIDATSASAVISASGLSFGADGQAASGATSYALSIAGSGATMLRTALGDLPISLIQTSGTVITGTFVEGGANRAAFTLTMNADGSLTVRQFVPVEHAVVGSNAAAFDDTLDLAGLVDATVTIRDFDNDTASATTGIGGLVLFRDDGPDSRLAVDAARQTLVLDETQPVGSDTAGAGSPAGVVSVSAGFADYFAPASFGADGAGNVSYALVLSGSDVGSGIHALDAGDRSATDSDPIGRGAEILLNQSGNVITGSAGGIAYFTIAVDPATGSVTFTQLKPVFNPQGGSNFDEAAILQVGAGDLLLRQIVTDSDGDSDSASIDIGQGQFQIQDDGPLARPDLDMLAAGTFGPETGNLFSGAGTSSGADGADRLGRDGASVVSIGAGNSDDQSFDEAGNLVVQGQHGVLSVRADGSYSYLRSEGSAGGVSDVFRYTLRDTDGDTSESTLTIRIGNLAPSLAVPAAGAAGTTVDEAGLPGRGAEPQGSGEEAAPGPDGDTSETTRGTIRYSDGDGPAIVTVGGVPVTGAGQTINTGEGILTIVSVGGGRVEYSYTLSDNLLAPSGSDRIDVAVTDRDGQSASGTLVITIGDDAPDARADLDVLPAGSLGPVVGNVITGEGTSAPAEGRDSVGADNALLVAVSGRAGSSDNEPDANGNLVVSGQFGVLTIRVDGSYSYLRDAGSPGGVSDVFSYTLRDGDGDEDTSTLTIAIGDAAPTLDMPDAGAPGTLVDEAGLPPRGGKSEGSGEEAAAGPNGDSRETTAGTIAYSEGDGPATVTIDGVQVTGAGQTIDTGEGMLTVVSFGGGRIEYSYTLGDNLLASSASDRLEVVVTDRDAQSASGTLVITIRDDAPNARNDFDLIGPGSAGLAVGNVISGEGTTDPVAGRDTRGADGASLVRVAGFNGAVAGQPNASGNLVVDGQYGVLTIRSDGSYSYLRNEGVPGGVSDTFTYTLRDGDGDEDSATLTIGIGDAPTDLEIPPAGGAATTVSELGLAPRENEAAGSGEIANGNPLDNSDASEQVTGSFTFEAPDGLAGLTVGGVSIAPDSDFPVTVTTPNTPGTLVIIGVRFDEATGAGSVSYRFALSDNVLGIQAVNGGSVDIGFEVIVRDSDGDLSRGTLAIRLIDDAADARNDSDEVAAGDYSPITGNVINGAGTTSGPAGRDIEGADGAQVTSVARDGIVVSQPDEAGNLVLQGQYGLLTINVDGSYTYARGFETPGGVSEVFTYTLRDGDGDVDTATLTIAIGNAGPTVNAPNAGVGGTLVDEAGLPARGAEPEGSGEEAAAGPNGDTSETTTGTITYSEGDSPAVITIEGVRVTGAGQTINTGEGVLTIVSFGDGRINYSYTLGDNLLEASASDRIEVVVTDDDGQSARDTLVMTIRDDGPDARDDLDFVPANSFGPAVGNVITGDGTSTPAEGRDTVGADNSRVVAVGGFDESTASEPDTDGNLVVSGQYGVLTIRADGSYSYLRNEEAPGGVSDVFTYTLRDGDGDEETATLTIVIGDAPQIDAPEVGDGGTSVFEAGLSGTRGSAESDGSGEAASPGVDSDTRETTAGRIAFSSGDAPSVIRINNQEVTAANQVIDTGEGLLTIVRINAGSIDYSYTLKDNLLGNQAVDGGDRVDVIPISITDRDGDSATDTLRIVVRDDKPSATNDVDSTGSGNAPATGNVITGTDHAGGDVNALDGSADVPGADGASVSQVSSDNVVANLAMRDSQTGELVIEGQYGTLRIAPNGDYSYTRSGSQPLTGQDVFTYRLSDGDGDTASATLTIDLADAPVTITPPEQNSAATTVFEAALGNRGSEPQGSGELVAAGDNGDTREAASGTIAFTAVDGVGSISLNGAALALNSTFPVTVGSDAAGSLVVTGITYSAETGAGSVAYTYTLADNMVGGVPPAGGDISQSFAFVVTDRDGDQSSGNLVITIRDDAPAAAADTDTLTEGATASGNVILGTGFDNNPAGVDTQGADGATVIGVRTGSDTSSAATGALGVAIAGALGTLTLRADGSYTYIANANSVSGPTTDVFTYTIRDADGDVSTTTLTITVNDVTLTPDFGMATVDEAALDTFRNEGDLASGTVRGSDPGSDNESTNGELSVAGAVSYTLVGPASGSFGVLQLNIDGSYRYTLTSPFTTTPGANDGAVVSGGETFTYRATDADGNSVQGTITIRIIDDVPTASNDSDVVTEGFRNVADGNVLTGAGGSDVNPEDGVADEAGADGGATVVGARTGGEEEGGGFTSVPAGAGGQVIAGTYGDLLIRADGSYSYTLKSAAIPAGVTGETFTYRMRDGDGDIDSAELNIRFVQDARMPTVSNSTGSVYEDGLADGLQHGPSSETVTGSFQVDLKGEAGSVTIGGVAVTNGAVFDTGEGTLAITGVNTANGIITYSYSYTLKGALSHEGQGEANPLTDTITVTVTDATGDSGSGTITIGIVDDVPLAAADSNSVAEGGTLTVSATGVLANDLFGADGQGAGGALIGVKSGTSAGAPATGVGLPIETSLGTLTLNANGSYTYVAKANVIGSATSDVFTYAIRDADGDISTTTLTINLNAVTLAADNRTVSVNEAALDTVRDPGELAAGTVTGSLPSASTESVSGMLNVTGGSGVTYTAQTLTTAQGVFELKADGSFTYTLTRNVDPAADTQNGANTVAEVELFTYAATDSSGNAVQGTIRVDVIDDVPTASADTAAQTAENAAITFGTFGNDSFGADGVDIDNAPLARVTFTQPAQGQVSYNPATGLFTFTPAAGQTGSSSFTYTIEDGDGDRSTATVTLNLLADSSPQVADALASVDDDGLAGGNPGGTSDIDANVGDLGPNTSEAAFSGKISVGFGNDTGTVSFANLHGQTVTVGQEQATLSWNAAASTLTATGPRGPLFQVVLDGAGNYSVTLLDNVLHTSADQSEASASVVLNYRAADSDGDVVTTGKLTVTFNDDTPNAFTPLAVTTTNGDTAAVTGQLNLSIGAEGFGSLVFSPTLNGQVARDANGNALSVGGQQLTYVVNGSTLAAQTASGVIGYVATLNPANGTYSIDVQNVISNGVQTSFNNLTGARAGNNDYVGIGANDAGSTTDILLSGSNAQGNPTTVNTDSDSIGLANQSMNNNEVLRIDFVRNLVTGTNANPSGFNYSGRSNTTNFTQTVPQVQADQGETVALQIWALNSANTSTARPDSTPDNGFSDATRVAITTVRIIDGASGTAQSATLSTLSPSADLGFGVTATLQGDGSVIFTGLQQGDRYGIGTGESQFNAVAVKALGDFDLGIFSVSTVSAATPIVQTLPVIATDQDGDTVSASITATINPAGTVATATAASATVLDTTTAMLGGEGHFGTPARMEQGALREQAANSNLALVAGLAAAFAAGPVAAQGWDVVAHARFSSDLPVEGGTFSSLGEPGAEGSDAGVRGDPLGAAGLHAEASAENVGGDAVHHVTGREFASADGEAGQSLVLSTLDTGTDLAASTMPSLAPFAGSEIHLPAPGQMVMLGGEGLGPQQASPSVGSVLADALSSGGLGAADIDGLIDAAISLAEPVQKHQAEEGAVAPDDGRLATLATPPSALVSSWDGGDFGPLFMATSMVMESKAQHPDAVQPSVNG